MLSETNPSVEDIRIWCRVCAADDQADELVASLRVVEGMFVEWRRLVRDGLRHVQHSRTLVYERTKRFRAYSSWLVPGMIQTPSYAEHVFRAAQRRHDVENDVEQALAARVKRKRLLAEGGRVFAFIIEESVLRSGVGGSAVMTEQLRRLEEITGLPNVGFGIIPARPDRERWPVEDFWIFDNSQVNVELVSGYLTVTQPWAVATYANTFAQLAGLAVHGAEARALITSVIKALR